VSVLQKVLIALCVVAAVVGVFYLAFHSPAAKAGGGAYSIPAPQGTRFEINGKVDVISQREGDRVIVTVVDNNPEQKAKVRWYYAGSNCQSVGAVGHALSDVQRCANDAMRKK
jgi:hypothetical protein